MTKNHDKDGGKQAARRAREERLARALRENLRRRKAQDRGRAGDDAAPPGTAVKKSPH